MNLFNKSKRYRFSRQRALCLFFVYLLIGLHIAYWKIYGRSLAPLEFNEVLYTIHLGIITAGFIFMAMALLGTLVFGRFFCSWGCHILALQDLSSWILQKFNIHAKPVRSRVLVIVPAIAMIYLFIWPQIIRIINHEQLPSIKILSDKDGWASFITTDFWRNLPGVGITLLTFFFSSFFITYLLGSRSFCRYVCPYSSLFSIADRFAPGKIKLAGTCDQCGLCTAHCHSHIQVHKELLKFGSVVNTQCLKDLDCIQVCPKEAIKFDFGEPSLFKSLKQQIDKEKTYDFSLKEDIFLAFSGLAVFLIFRGLYDKVPFLLAITIAVCFSYIFLVLTMLVRLEYVRISNYVFKQGNKLTFNGQLFIVCSTAVISLVLHSGFIHYHAYKGGKVYEYIRSLENKTLITSKTKIEAINKIESGIYHLEQSEKYGLYSSEKLFRQLASLYIYKKNYPRAQLLLESIIAQNPYDMEVRLQLARILFKTGKNSEALNELEDALSCAGNTHTSEERNWIARINFMAGNLSEQKDSQKDALRYYAAAIRMDSTDGRFYLALSSLYLRVKLPNWAEMTFNQGIRFISDETMINLQFGQIYLAQNKTEEAINSLEKVLKLQPFNAKAHYLLNMASQQYGPTNPQSEQTKVKSDIGVNHVLVRLK